MKKIVFGSIIGVFALIVGAGAYMYAFSEPAVNPDPNHTHIDFAVYIEGRKFDFSDEKYMSTKPVEAYISPFDLLGIPQVQAHDGDADNKNVSDEHAYLHLHDGNGSVIHRHKPGLTIGDFFTSIGFKMTTTCLTLDTGRAYCPRAGKKWEMFVNGSGGTLNPDYAFNDLDQILLTYAATPEQLQEQLTALSDDACLYSRTCPERGDPPVENCIADPAVPCVAP